MRRTIPRSTWVFGTLVATFFLAQTQVGAVSPRKKRAEPPPPKVEETVGDLAIVAENGELKVEGVGLVRGLDNTGADPPPSWHRQQLVDEMSKAGVEHATKWLANPQFSMVIVRMTIPTGANPSDRLDVEVEVPPACGTKSLAGGYLMMTRLREVLVAGGTPRTGTEIALAQGPVMLGNSSDPTNPKVGRVLGGGRVKKDFPFSLVIKEKRKSVRTAAMLEKVINERFHQSEGGKQKGAATAKTDGYLVLKVPSIYHQNTDRYFRVLQLLPMIDTPALRVQRMAAWKKELLDPVTGGVAALKLEGLGPSASETLQAGLKSENAQVRFFAAEALAYLNDPAGAEVLAQTAIAQRQFRAYALAALAAMEQSASEIKLRQLMDQPDIEVRYGAFNALRTIDPLNPLLGRVHVIDEPKPEEGDDESPDAMAVALASRRPRADDPFDLYVVDSEGPPVVHVSQTRRSEVVLFGSRQQLLPPIVLGTGPILLNAAEKDAEIEISKIVPSRFGDSDVKVRSSLDLADVIRQAANLGATYPEIVTILEGANRQKNLAGQLVVDAVPVSNMEYLQAAILGKDTTAKQDDAVKRVAAQPSSGSRLRRLFGFWNRDAAEAPSKDAALAKNQTRPSDKGTESAGEGAIRDAGSQSDQVAQRGAPAAATAAPASGAAASSNLPAKKDESLKKASAEETPAPRFRFFDRFRRGSD